MDFKYKKKFLVRIFNYNLTILDGANLDLNNKSQNGKQYLQKGDYSISIKTDNTTIVNQFKIK